MAEITFRNVSKRYGEMVAVNDASFTIHDNEFFCLFGPPLSGKSTILRLILGLEKADEGEILIGGRSVKDVSPAERNVAMVFQNLALFPHMTARDNVRFPLVERKVDVAVIRTRVEAVSEKLHIGHILHKLPAQLSGGERQRVAIARALVRDPAVYLMDDPISALDARLREETRVELKRIQRELGHTLVYVTHDQEEAMSVGDRIAILEAGAVRQIGTPGEVYDSPLTIYVARMLGSPAMNIVPAAVRAGALFLEAAEGTIRLPFVPSMTETVEIGVRPEDLKVEPWVEAAEGRPARVFEVEPLGGHTVVTLEAGDSMLKALMRGQPEIAPASLVALSCSAARVHFFGKTGETIARPRQA